MTNIRHLFLPPVFMLEDENQDTFLFRLPMNEPLNFICKKVKGHIQCLIQGKRNLWKTMAALVDLDGVSDTKT